MANTKALVTIAIGDAYVQPWKLHCYPSWKRYADRHGYDIVLITTPLDSSPRATSRSPSWQRLLILHHPAVAKYDDVVWLDADIVINTETSPCVVATSASLASNEATIGAVTGSDSTTADPVLEAAVNRRQTYLRQTLNQGLTWNKVYRLNGFQTDLDAGFNAGVMVVKPAQHRLVFQEVYESYQQTPHSWLEGVPLAYHLMSRQLVHHIPSAFNVNASQVFYEHYPFLLAAQSVDPVLMKAVVATMLENSHFLHFLGGGIVRNAMTFVPPLP
jgi:hypothetical protein